MSETETNTETNDANTETNQDVSETAELVDETEAAVSEAETDTKAEVNESNNEPGVYEPTKEEADLDTQIFWELIEKYGSQNNKDSRKNKKTSATEGEVRYSKRSSYDEWDVQAALYDALDHEDRRNEHIIRVGTMPKYIVDKLGIDGDFYIYRNHIYENMVSEDRAKEDDRYVEGRHYHDLGFETLEAAIMALENPILSIATQTKKNNPAAAMILPVKGKNGVPLFSVMSFYSQMSVNGDFSTKPHVVLSIYEMDMLKENDGEAKKSRDKSLEEIVEQAVKDRKIFDFDKKMRDALSVIAERTRLGDITETSLKESLSQFRKEIKTYKEKNKISYSKRISYDESIGEDELREENEKLKGDVAKLKDLIKLQRTLTHGKLFTNSSVQHAAERIMKNAGIHKDKSALIERLHAYYSSIASAEALDWQTVFGGAADIASEWYNKNHKAPIDEDVAALKRLLRSQSIRLSQSQRSEAAAIYGTYGDFHRSNFGRIKISEDGVPLEVLIGEWAENYPQYFDEYTSEGDALRQLDHALRDVYSSEGRVALSEYEAEQAIRDIAMNIYDEYWNISTLRTWEDRRDAEIKQMRAAHNNRMREIREKRDATISQLKKHYIEKYNAMRDKKNAQIAEQAQKYREKISEGVEARGRKAIKERILNTRKRLNRYLNHGTKDRNVKEELRDTIATAIASIDLIFGDVLHTEDKDDIVCKGFTVRLNDNENKIANITP